LTQMNVMFCFWVTLHYSIKPYLCNMLSAYKDVSSLGSQSVTVRFLGCSDAQDITVFVFRSTST